MVLILADVGGTNVRFATAQNGMIDPAGVRRYRNDNYASFDAALEDYVASENIANVEALTVAVAGPVNGTKARLTNRGWDFDTHALAEKHTNAAAFLLNDLSALGYALDSLGEEGAEVVLQAPANDQDQRLVVGAGTGFNVSPVLRAGDQTICLRAEAGLCSLPSRVQKIMEDYIGGPAGWVRCAEDAVRGPGLAELHAAATGTPKKDASEVMAAASSGDSAALASTMVYARMLGAFVQDLRLLYMSGGGIYLAGSVVRGLLSSPARDTFIETLHEQPTVKQTMQPVRVSVITQDEAALLGCLAYARSVV
ncbi:glucokinase [uncultured Roseobacter sp.]|uniref:glucokinase n=1 Tax=uncultured Roseobacter sp. TaxID=114847 RepID=UPI002629A06E|nr:glucokinase [uncultured Roseobacter sp.]